MDGASTAVAQDKAASAAMFRRPTKVFQDAWQAASVGRRHEKGDWLKFSSRLFVRDSEMILKFADLPALMHRTG